MAEPFLSSDPNAWMRPYWADLHRQSPFFRNLAPELQAIALAEAVEADHATKAAEIREWNPATRRAMLAGLDQGLRERHAAKETALWRVRKGERELQCLAVYLITGIDLRLLERGEIRRTELFAWAHVLTARARTWRQALERSGWREIQSEDARTQAAGGEAILSR